MPTETTDLTYQREYSGTVSAVADVVSEPWTWIGIGGFPAGFIATLSWPRRLSARGTVLRDSPTSVAYTWKWCGGDMGQHPLPAEMVVELTMERQKGRKVVLSMVVRGVPTSMAQETGTVFRWALDRLEDRLQGNVKLPPWGR